MPGTVKLQTVAGRLSPLDAQQREPQRQPGYCHVTVRLPLGDFTAGQMRVLADLAEAYGDGTMRLTVEQNVLFRWVKTESLEPFYQRLAAAGLGAPDANTLGDVVSCPGAESCRLAVTQSRGLGRVLDRAPERPPELVDLVPSGAHQDQRLPERLRPASHRVDRIPGQRAQGRSAVPCRSTFVLVGGGSADDGATLRQGRVEGAGASADGRGRSAADALQGTPGAG